MGDRFPRVVVGLYRSTLCAAQGLTTKSDLGNDLQGLTDEFFYNDAGNEVTLVKRFSRSS
jgi:hypothetical protein